VFLKENKDTLNDVGDVLKVVAQVLLGVFQAAIRASGIVIQGLVRIFKGVIKAIRGVVKVFSSALKGDFRGMWEGVKQIFSGAVEAILGAMRVWIAPMLALGGEIMDRFGDGVRKGFEAVKNFVTSIPGKLLGFLSSLPRLLFGAGVAVMTGLLDGIKAGFTRVTSFVGSIPGKIKDLKGPLPKDLKMLFDEGKAITTGLASGIEAGAPAVWDAINKVMGRLERAGGKAQEIASNMLTLSGIEGAGVTKADAVGAAKTAFQAAKKEQFALLDAIPTLQKKLKGLKIPEKKGKARDRALEKRDKWRSEMASLRTRLVEIQGLSGRGGEVFDLAVALANLGDLSGLPELAEGTRNFRGGAAIVGERGPELVNLPRGSQVFPNGSGGGLHIEHFHSDGLDPEAIAARLAWQLQTRAIPTG